MVFSALFTLYDSALLSNKYDDSYNSAIVDSIEMTSNRIVAFSTLLFGDISKVNIDAMSPFTIYSLYQSAIVQYRLWKQTGLEKYEVGLNTLKTNLGTFSLRWQVAGKELFKTILYQLTRVSGKYLDSLNALTIEWPETMLFLHGEAVSARGPTGDPSRPYID